MIPANSPAGDPRSLGLRRRRTSCRRRITSIIILPHRPDRSSRSRLPRHRRRQRVRESRRRERPSVALSSIGGPGKSPFRAEGGTAPDATGRSGAVIPVEAARPCATHRMPESASIDADAPFRGHGIDPDALRTAAASRSNGTFDLLPRVSLTRARAHGELKRSQRFVRCPPHDAIGAAREFTDHSLARFPLAIGHGSSNPLHPRHFRFRLVRTFSLIPRRPDGSASTAPLRKASAWANTASRSAPVAQLDRALPSEGKGHTFESCRVRQQSQRSSRVPVCHLMAGGCKSLNATGLVLLSIRFRKNQPA